MQAFVECLYCYLKQATNCMALSGVDEDTKYRVIFELMDLIKNLDPKKSPAENSTEILLKTYELIGDNDPYKEVKMESNSLALKLYPGLRKHLDSSKDKLLDALKISVAGNVIDLGINKSFDINKSLEQSLNTGFSKCDYGLFEKKLAESSDVLIVGDNSGEIVFDRLLVEELVSMGKEVTYMVKGGPILNDVTIKDANQAGMDKIARIVTTGSNYLGAPLHRLSHEAISYLKNAGVIISKGQANYESLEHKYELTKGRIFFLLKIKCECVGKVAEADMGSLVFFTNQ